VSSFDFNEDADGEEELLDEVGEGEPDETSDDSGAGGEDPAAR